VGLARVLAVVDVVLGAQQALDLVGIGIKLNPLLVDGLRDAVGVNARRLQPVADRRNGVRRGGEELVDLLGGIVLSVVGGLVMRPDQDCEPRRRLKWR
jgi:hypothetical protein